MRRFDPIDRRVVSCERGGPDREPPRSAADADTPRSALRVPSSVAVAVAVAVPVGVATDRVVAPAGMSVLPLSQDTTKLRSKRKKRSSWS